MAALVGLEDVGVGEVEEAAGWRLGGVSTRFAQFLIIDLFDLLEVRVVLLGAVLLPACGTACPIVL